MTTVRELVPGFVVVLDDRSATYITQTQHPIWPQLQLVIWRLANGSFSLDALSPHQHVGDVVPSTREQREQQLRGALLAGQPDGVPPGWSAEKWATMSRQQRRAARRAAS